MNRFIEICKKFNRHGVKYVVCGAWACKIHGVEKISNQKRKTADYDFVVEDSIENTQRIKKALQTITPEVKDLRETDLKKYQSVRVIGKDIIDLITKMWGVDYEKAHKDQILKKVKKVEIPVISISNLLEMKKDSHRARDIADTYWLKKIRERKP
jgi:histone deacetylase complex regulatory component SIN3